MTDEQSVNKLFADLKERAKELNCLYEVQEILNNCEFSVSQICNGILKAIPPGLQYPDVCQARIKYYESVYQTEGFTETEWMLKSGIKVQDEIIGSICVNYTKERPEVDEGPFLKEEQKLIDTISEQFGFYILNLQLKAVFVDDVPGKKEKNDWEIILDLLKNTNPKLFVLISRNMVNHLYLRGIKESKSLLEYFSPGIVHEEQLLKEVNLPFKKSTGKDLMSISYDVFYLAEKYMGKEEILNNIQRWIQEDQTSFLADIVQDTSSSLSEISAALKKYHHLSPQGVELSKPRETSLIVALIRRLLNDQQEYINIAKHFITLNDFNKMLKRVIFPVGSQGKVGGKSSGLFLADKILKKSKKHKELFENIKIPKTWYISSDNTLKFMSNNKLEDILEQKYKDIGQVKQEYPYVVHVFKNSSFERATLNDLSHVLDDFGEVPLVVRSSSLLEDRVGTAFAGKYKSLFIANQGDKEKRMNELVDAIAEVYASIFGPDPIEYRIEHDLLDFHEEMGIMIQEVVGKKVGKYFFPAFAGVAFSYNEFRWSSRIDRDDGLIRLVPGLGTRAVDRLKDDYPILIAPGQPGLKVNVSIEDAIRYSPKNLDVIDLETGSFETVSFNSLLKKYGHEYPGVHQLVSVIKDNYFQQPRPIGTDFTSDEFVLTANGLISNTSFVEQIEAMLDVLQEKYNFPVDIEFAHDGDNLYLLQCRSQSHRPESNPAVIPTNSSQENILFSANRYISNGIVSNITHVVYVDPQKYSEVKSYEELVEIGKSIGRLNKILPKQQFILMGPGRWGSRGDIKLGVNITYSDINNTAMLIEIARKQKDYIPDLSFGTHFFQDLVEANIRYLPLYPDDNGVIFNDHYFENTDNILADLLPDYEHLKEVVSVIDVGRLTNGQVVQVYMNAELEKAVGLITEPSEKTIIGDVKNISEKTPENQDKHWQWRLQIAESIASVLDAKRFGVKAFYIFGSTKNATAGPASDIDILIHFIGNKEQLKGLNTWLEGWSISLDEVNYQQTGYRSGGLLDIHIVTDEDIAKHSSYAVKIGAVTDAARPLAIGTALKVKS
ncbi:MAG: PEP/pyruvate-binding domain-containing protein [Bacteroidota bacterium]